MSREAKVESELYRLLKNVLEKRGCSAEGVRFEGVEPQYRVDNRRADLALVLAEKRVIKLIRVFGSYTKWYGASWFAFN